jgi:hypothetical protein
MPISFYQYISENFIDSTKLTRNDLKVLHIILEYVYSFGNNRRAALDNIHSNITSITESIFSRKLPSQLTVSRWFDWRDKKLRNNMHTILTQRSIKLDWQPVSFSSLTAVSWEKILKTKYNTHYGIIIEKDLSDCSGHYIVIHSLIRTLQNEDFLRGLFQYKDTPEGYKVLDWMYKRDIMTDPYDAVKFQEPIKIRKEHLNEFDYEDQKEVLVISDCTRLIQKEEIKIKL